ncbi:SIR2 family protein [Nonomuraea sp. NPDC059023]|uniref:SIR2 family protein n=1 Tax=unclassified Nonomuraea TaxID=2593643 RepID=UPI0036A4F9C9
MSAPIPSELIDSVRHGETIVFCGAGLSAQAGLPTGVQLAHGLSDRIDGFDGNKDDLVEVSTTYSAMRGRHALLTFLLGRVNDDRLPPTAAHLALCGLPFTAYVSTNWDHLIERALHVQRIRHRTLVTDSELPFLQSAEVPVIKLHGTLARPDTIVVTDKDYYDLFAVRPGLASLVDGYFATKTLLFIGYALNDPDFKRIFYTCTRRFGPLRRRAYAVQRGVAAATIQVWREEHVDVIDQDALSFSRDLAAAV